ncbi:MAG TPA: GNAT family N-acetyltransferase [Kofleriaceae bacterium]
MNRGNATDASDVSIRPLLESDFEPVVALDRRITGGTRRGYFEQRLTAARRQPTRHVQLAAATPSSIAGFLFARAAGGEFGRVEEALALEAIGVEPTLQHAGLGQRMMAELGALGRARGIGSVVTQAVWRNHEMLRFLDGAGFRLASQQILERAVHRMPLPGTDEEIETLPPLVRHLREGDLDMIARIDKAMTGRDRAAYLKRKVDEALHESPIVVSPVAEDDGFVVAFAMARVDYGDFGHVEPTASLDTIGVNPAFGRRGFARAILTQMIDNMSALHVERLETEVARDNFALFRFLHRFGFRPSERLPFSRALQAAWSPASARPAREP